jgi:NAD+ kinase
LTKVVFEDEQAAIKRRKSSMVASMLPDVSEHSEEKIDCMVHQLIQAHRNEYIKGLKTETHAHDQESQSHPNHDHAQVVGALHDADPMRYRRDKDPNGLSRGIDKPVQTRLMSKKQLSGMAFGIRELSKRLAHIKLKLKVQNIFVLGKAYDETVVHLTRDLTRFLLERDQKHRV